ncbi:hypothetical protein GCM10028857_21510 [Salinarchaeum chitinilyticum]
MFETLERVFAGLGYCTVFIALVACIGVILPQFAVPIYVPLAAVLIAILWFVLSFISFRKVVNQQAPSGNYLWKIVFIAFALYIPFNLILLAAGVVELRLNDFGAYYNAAVRFLESAPLYKTTAEIPTLEARTSENMGYLYPPLYVLVFVPFTLFSPFVAGILWNVIVLLFLLWSVSRLISTFDLDVTRNERILLYVLVASFAPTITWMKLGQISGLLAAFLCLSGAALRSKRHKLSAVTTVLGSSFKPFYATSGAHLLRDRRRFLSAIASVGGILLLSVILFGVETHLEYIEVLREGKGWETSRGPSDWHATHFNPFYLLGPFKQVPRVGIVLGTAALALYSNKLETPIEYIFALGVAIVPLAGPTTNTLALNAVIPAMLMVGLYELETEGEVPAVLLISALLIHMHPYTIEILGKLGPQIYPPLEMLAPALPLLQPALYGMILLVGYILYRSLETSSVQRPFLA